MSAPNLIYPPSTGGGGGGVSGSGTPNFLPIWSTATSLSDSPLSFSGSTLTFSSSVTTQAFGSPQSWTVPANTAGWRINTTQLIFDTSAGQLGIGTPSGPAAPLHVEGAVGAGELFRLRNQSTGASAHVAIRTHANGLGSGSPSGLIQNFVSSTTPGFGVYDWVYSLPTPGGTMTEVLRSTAPTVILTVTLTNGGSGYANGNYSEVALTNVSSSGTGATADILVSTTSVTSVTLRSGGSGYQVGDTLTCASIGGGTGFVLTVASVGSRSTATAAVTAPRIGAGTSTPRASMDVRNGALVDGFGAFTHFANTGSPIFVGMPIALEVTNQSAALNTLALGANNFGSRAINVAYRVDTTAQTATNYNYGIATSCVLAEAGAATAAAYGGNFLAGVNTTGMTGRTLQLVGGSGVISIAAAGGTNTFTNTSAFEGLLSVSATVAQNITLLRAFGTSSVSISGAAHSITTAVGFDLGAANISTGATVTNFYGLRLAAPSLSGGSTITNRYPIAQDDVAGRNYLRSKVFVGPSVGTVQQSGASVEVEATNTILTGTITAGGTLYTDGTYTNQVFTGGAPTVQARGNFVVSGGIVTSVTLINGGEGYAVGNVLSCALPAGAGFQWTVATIQGNGDVRLRSASATFDASNSSTNGVRFFNRAGTGQTSNTLNWYEEGTYTPTTVNFTLGSCTATWTRIGRKVFVTLNFAAGTNNGSTIAGASSIGLPAGLAPARSGAGLRMQVTGAASGNGVVAVNAATGFIEISSTVTLDTNAKVIQAEYEV